MRLSDVVRPYLDVLWFGQGATPAMCDAYLRNMVQDAQQGATIITRGVIPGGSASEAQQQTAARAATAATLLADYGKTYVRPC